MKKKIIGAAALFVFAAAAHAQSSVTLYGLIDTGIVYTNNQGGSSAWQVQSSMLSNEVWGLKGSEDLGSNLHAIFKLENGFNIQNGKTTYANTMFGRQAYVGLQHDQFGTVTLGRQYDSVVDDLGPIALANNGDGNNLAAHPFDNDNVDDSFYINNSVKYVSPAYRGVQAEALYGFSNAAGGFADNRAYSFGLTYSIGPINLAAAYLQLNNGSLSSSGAVSNNDFVNFPASRQRVMGVGGNYTIGPAVIGLLWTHSLFDNTQPGANSVIQQPFDSLHFDNYEFNVHYAVTPAISLAGAYTFTQASVSGATGTADPKWHQVTLMADYSFSKRTDVYVEGVYQHAYGAAGTAFEGAFINGLAQSSTGNQVVATVGMRTRF
ncbi:porin [Paraburkholderia humisilvae]|uniref:Outer membrane porin protein n=1 Tax=Paraburkholderia humisilvae TaxID=627669 RepID=A0A6J5EV82_9BURK|nr:porin [Paraburkholderia humisilvae]CAB3768955.1 Outer membrane porin protein [Paraburkholderia humisilvae]